MQKYNGLTQDISERLNIVKWLFTVMVVFIHATALPEVASEIVVPEYVKICKKIVTEGVCSMAVPGFFGIAGFFLFRKHFIWMENIKKNSDDFDSVYYY